MTLHLVTYLLTSLTLRSPVATTQSATMLPASADGLITASSSHCVFGRKCLHVHSAYPHFMSYVQYISLVGCNKLLIRTSFETCQNNKESTRDEYGRRPFFFTDNSGISTYIIINSFSQGSRRLCEHLL